MGRSVRFFLYAMFLLSIPSIVEAAEFCAGDIVVSDFNLDAVFKIDPVTGDRTMLSGADRAIACHSEGTPLPCCTDFFQGMNCDPAVGEGPEFLGPAGLTIDANGDILLVDRNLSQVYRIDPTTGDRTIISGMDRGDEFCREEDFPFDCCTGLWIGEGAPCARTGSGTARESLVGPIDIVIEPSGSLLVYNNPDQIQRIDPITGDRDIVSECRNSFCSGSTGIGAGFGFGFFGGIALQADGSLVVTNHNERNDIRLFDGSLLRVDPGSGDRNILSGFISLPSRKGAGPYFKSPYGVAIEPNGDIIVSDFDVKALYRVNPITGDRTIISGEDLSSQCIRAGIPSGGTPFACCTGPGTGDGSPPCARVGEGPSFTFEFSGAIALEADGSILVADFDSPDFDFVGRVLRVDPVTGDRTIVSSPAVGSGPVLHTPLAIAVVPQEADSDNDCIPAGRDLCPDTSPGEVTDLEGCSIAQRVPCEGPAGGEIWKNHGRYVSSVMNTARRFHEDGLISAAARKASIKEAAQSTCGRD